jgi:hypothetical protein
MSGTAFTSILLVALSRGNRRPCLQWAHGRILKHRHCLLKIFECLFWSMLTAEATQAFYNGNAILSAVEGMPGNCEYDW